MGDFLAEVGKEAQKQKHGQAGNHGHSHDQGHGHEKNEESHGVSETFLESLKDLSNKDIEPLIDKKNPEFISQLETLKADFAEVKLEITPLSIETAKLEKPKKFKDKVKHYPKFWFKNLKTIFVFLFIHLKYFILWLASELPKAASKGIGAVVHLIKDFIETFKHWSKKRKIIFALSMVFLSGVLYFYIVLLKDKLLYRDTFYFYGSMDQLGEWAVRFEEDEHIEPFYHSPRLKAYSYQMPPIVANLKRLNKDRENPMGFFEFVIEGNSGDSVVELKLRESEFIDLVQRVIEDHRYEELDTAQGMADLKNDIRSALNAQLNEGLVTGVEIRNFFIKP